MAHNIHERKDGTYAAYYADKPAWHGLGEVGRAVTADQLARKVPEFRKAIALAPVFARIGGKLVEIDDRRATHRVGSTTVLGIVAPDYPAASDMDGLRTMEAIIEAARARARKAGFVTGGLLGKGERAFASIDLSRVLNGRLKVKRDPSPQEAFLFGSWQHDGDGSMKFGLWRNRVECQNMLNMASADAEARGLLVRIVHSGDMAAKLREAQRILGFAEQVAEADVAELAALADIAIPKPKLWIPGFTELVLPTAPDAGDRAVRNVEANREVIRELFLGSKTLVGVPMSPYRAFQAVAEWADHHRPLRIGAETDLRVAADRRFRSITEGPAAKAKARARELLRQEFEVPVGAGVASAN